MTILLLILLLVLAPSAHAQNSGTLHPSQNFNAIMTNVPSAGKVPVATGPSTAQWQASGVAGNPGGTNGQVQYNNAGVFGGFTMMGDCTINASTGAITCTRLNGVVPGGTCSGSTPFVASLNSQAVPSCMSATTSPSFRAFTLLGATSGSVAVGVPAVAGSTTFQLPGSNGTGGQFLQTDGSGHTSWASPSGGGTVNPGTANQLTYYAATGTTLSGNPNATITNGMLTLGVATSVQGSLTLSGATSGTFALAAPGTITSYTLTMPGSAGAQGSFLYSSDGAGTLANLTAGSSGQLLFGQTTSTVPAWHALSGDCTVTNAGAITCTKTNGVNFAASATTDTTNAANISSGTLPATRLPNPGASSLGGIESLASVSHRWINQISTSGVPSATQPASTDLSDLPIPLTSGGRQCGGPVAVASLPGSPVTGEQCIVNNDSTGCVAGTPVSGGGSGVCLVGWSGTQWLPGGGVTSSATGGVTAVNATAPIASSGGTTPTISITSPLPLANGGLNTGTSPTSGQVPIGNAGGTAYAPQSLSGDVTVTNAGVTTAAKVNGVAYSSGPSTHTVPIITAANTATYKAITDCNGGSSALNYTQSTDSFSCNSITASAGGTSGQIQYNNSGALGGFTASGDATINTGTGAVSVTKIAGTTPGGTCSGSTPLVASLSSSAVPTCMATTVTPHFGAVTSGANSGTGGSIVLNGATSGSDTIQVGTNAGTGTIFQLPGNNGTNGQFLQTNGSGVASWASPAGSGTVNAGTANQMAYYASTGTAVSGNANATISSGALTLGVAASAQGSLSLSGATAGALTVAAPASITSYTLTLPGTAPGQGAFLYASNGTGTLASLSPGSSSQILISQGGSTVPSWLSLSGDCTIAASGAITCTKTNGTAFSFFTTLANLTGDTTTSGSGVTTTAKVNGVSYPASPLTHQVAVVTAANTATYKTIPDCPTSGGTQALNYTQSSDTFSCNAVSGGGGGGGPIISVTHIIGTTAGDAYCWQPWQTNGYMEVRCKLIGYENTTGVAQTYTFPTPFNDAGYFVGNIVPLALETATTLTFPTNMLQPTGTVSQPTWIEIHGD